MNSKILYISSLAFTSEAKGGTAVARRNFQLFCDYFGRNEIFPWKLNYFRISGQTLWEKICCVSKAFYNMFLLRGNGCSKDIEDKIVHTILTSGISLVFVEGSLNGRLIRRISRECKIPVMCFFHNCETVLLWRNRSYKDYIRLPFVFLSEYLTCRYADFIITLSERDKRHLYSLYSRKADFVFPITMDRHFNDQGAVIEQGNRSAPYCLFVGSDFLPNNQGICWFIDNVAAHIPMDTYVAGSCCRYVSMTLKDIPTSVYLLGKVDNLQSYYIHAACVVIPLFKGSGMKTKTIEAMSYGKTIYGTSEAFVGIDVNYEKIGGLCNNAGDFIYSLSSEIKNMRRINEYTATLFKEKYETKNVKKGFYDFLDSLK